MPASVSQKPRLLNSLRSLTSAETALSAAIQWRVLCIHKYRAAIVTFVSGFSVVRFLLVLVENVVWCCSTVGDF